jgi:DNA repair exonuclease SbcCD ATPase subunit
VDALGRAIQVLSKQDYDRPQAEMLLQQLAKTTPGMQRVLAAFLQESAKSDGAPAVAAYEFQSGGIVQILEGLEKKFQKELDDVESEEANKQHAYDLEVLHLSDTITKSKSDRDEKSVTKARTMEASAQAKGELADTKTELAENQKFVADMKATFEAKTRTFEANQEVRKNELEALSKAIEIISSPDVAGSYGEHVNLAQTTQVTASFLQMHRSSKRTSVRQRATQFLQRRAKSLSSTALLSVAAQMAGGPFDKVVTMIEELITKLKEEAAAEADHKAWCDEQLKNNKLKREKKTAHVEKLSAEIESLDGQIATMAEEIKTLAKEQKELATAMSEATAQRQKEKAKNTKAISDAQAGSEAVKQAIVVLREFYSSQAFIQVRRQVPEMAEYKGMQSAKGGVVGMLEVIQTDFMRLEADTKSAEAAAAKEYDEFMEDAKSNKKAKHDREVQLKLDKDQAEFDKSQTAKDLAGTEEELGKANDYYEYLKPSCLEVKVSYEDRVARRKEEIEALKEAYKILDSK